MIFPTWTTIVECTLPYVADEYLRRIGSAATLRHAPNTLGLGEARFHAGFQVLEEVDLPRDDIHGACPEPVL